MLSTLRFFFIVRLIALTSVLIIFGWVKSKPRRGTEYEI